MAASANRGNTAAGETVTGSQLLNALCESGGLGKEDAEVVPDEPGVVIERRVNRRAAGGFTLPCLLKIKVARKPATRAHKMVSPFTGPEITVAAKPASRRVRVQPLSWLRRTAVQGAARPPSGSVFRCRA